MDHFHYCEGQYFAEGVSLARIASTVGTPCYVYSRAILEQRWRLFDDAFGDYPHRIHYAVKANGNLAILKLLCQMGSGFDIVSGGELERVLKAGGRPDDMVFSGVGKRESEITTALEAGIHCINVESAAELDRVNRIAGTLGAVADLALRINPDVDPHTHPYIATGLRENKFGIPIDEVPDLVRQAHDANHVNIIGLACHIGSQLTELSPFVAALDRVLELVFSLRQEGLQLKHLDIGGGLGIRYGDETPPEPDAYVKALLNTLSARQCNLPLFIEPGRAIVGNAGVLLTRVEYLKSAQSHQFAVVDAAMNDLLRPALYGAHHRVIEVSPADVEPTTYDVVGPICETADFLSRSQRLSISPGDLLVVQSVGAYGSAMSSNYNSRPRSAEVIVEGDKFHVVRRHETLSQLYQNESTLPD
jgi:diaminopimelate decarboxylase|tara:strand:+ start:2389 stop:3642 length:1254 start_codon:yes stop_codon:yes gene_type:complete